jgi:hypothetical protein
MLPQGRRLTGGFVMPTLVLPPRRNDDCRAVRDAAAAEGCQVFEASGWRFPSNMSLDEPVIYGARCLQMSLLPLWTSFYGILLRNMAWDGPIATEDRQFLRPRAVIKR